MNNGRQPIPTFEVDVEDFSTRRGQKKCRPRNIRCSKRAWAIVGSILGLAAVVGGAAKFFSEKNDLPEDNVLKLVGQGGLMPIPTGVDFTVPVGRINGLDDARNHSVRFNITRHAKSQKPQNSTKVTRLCPTTGRPLPTMEGFRLKQAQILAKYKKGALKTDHVTIGSETVALPPNASSILTWVNGTVTYLSEALREATVYFAEETDITINGALDQDSSENLVDLAVRDLNPSPQPSASSSPSASASTKASLGPSVSASASISVTSRPSSLFSPSSSTTPGITVSSTPSSIPLETPSNSASPAVPSPSTSPEMCTTTIMYRRDAPLIQPCKGLDMTRVTADSDCKPPYDEIAEAGVRGTIELYGTEKVCPSVTKEKSSDSRSVTCEVDPETTLSEFLASLSSGVQGIAGKGSTVFSNIVLNMQRGYSVVNTVLCWTHTPPQTSATNDTNNAPET